MQNSQVNTLSVPAQATGVNPALLMKAADVPLRVVVTNVGPNLILLGHDVNTLSAVPAVAGTFRLATTKEQTIILAPGQGLFATSIGAGGSVSIASSDALPIG